MNRYSLTLDARTPPGHDRFTAATSTYAACLLESALHSAAVAIPLTRPFAITGWHVAAHPRGAVVSLDCAARDARAAQHGVRTLLDQAQRSVAGPWAPFTAWSFAVTEVRPHPANT